ncbi:TGS domain-containing protein, partial [bacterium]|nr:TGS domain-containing protein [bacterium]
LQLIDLPPIGEDYFEPWIPSLIRVSDLILLVVLLDQPEDIETIITTLKDYKIELVNSFRDADYKNRIVKIPVIQVATGNDDPDAEIGMEILQEEHGEYEILPLTTTSSDDAGILGDRIMKKLNLVRVYTRAPGKEPRMDKPVVIRKGSVLLDVAVMIHKDFAVSLKYARVWGSGKFDGQRIQKDYIISEGDVFEFKV